MRFVIVLFILCCNICGYAKAVTIEPLSIELMSYNVRLSNVDDGKHSWPVRKSALRQSILEAAPDIVGLQEATYEQLAYVAGIDPAFVAVGEGRDGGLNGEYSAIVYRSDKFVLEKSDTFWFSDSPKVPSHNWGNRFNRICTWARFRVIETGHLFYVFNMHWDHESQKARELSAAMLNQTIAKQVEHDATLFVMGDFNAGESNKAILELKAQSKLKDSYRKVHPMANNVGTFHHYSGDDTGPKIDHIFYRGNTDVIDAKIIKSVYDGLFPSDHFPITATVHLPKHE